MTHFRRAQATHAKEWGCYAWTSGKMRVRRVFKGLPQVDAIDGHVVVDWPQKFRTRRQIVSWLLIATLMGVTTLVIGLVLWLKIWSLNQEEGSFWHTHGKNISVALNCAQMLLFNVLFDLLSTRLTQYENWKLDSEYVNSLIIKLFVTQFYNTFAPVFYVAFLEESLSPGGCRSEGGCLEEL